MATSLVIPQSPVLDNRGYLAREWLLFFLQAAEAAAAAGSGTVTNASPLGAGLVLLGAGGDGIAALAPDTDGYVLTQVGGVGAWAPATGGSSGYQKGAAWDAGGQGGLLNATAANIVRGTAQAAGTIQSAYAVGSGVGSANVEVWMNPGAPATGANKISGLSPITLSSQQESLDTSLIGWTTAVPLNARFGFSLLNATGLSWLAVILTIG